MNQDQLIPTQPAWVSRVKPNPISSSGIGDSSRLTTRLATSITKRSWVVTHGLVFVVSGEIQLVLVNHCKDGVWPGVLGSAGHSSPEGGGFHLGVGQEAVLDVPSGWSGRIWGRQGCCFDENGKGSCDSGDCGGLLRCNGTGGTPPATVVEMTLGTHRSPLHFYDVSLVEGFNLPVTIAPVGGGKGCGGVAGCQVDLNTCCPSRFEVKQKGKVVGCKSACLALKTDKYCCTGEYGSPERCKPTLFSHLFKSICPRAYSFAYDSSSTLNMCRASRLAHRLENDSAMLLLPASLLLPFADSFHFSSMYSSIFRSRSRDS
ncbi:unnamed protein product [Musa banksii]